jgi:hypothetical protein
MLKITFLESQKLQKNVALQLFAGLKNGKRLKHSVMSTEAL